MPNPVLTLQTGSLYASGEDSTFTGTGGPWGFSPFTSQFGGIVGSAGLATEPFNDTVYGVGANDELIFVIAVQNTTPAVRAHDVRIRATIPAGFVLPPDGIELSTTDGAGNDLATSGDLFGPAGLAIIPPLAPYDPDSGANLALVTYTLKAGPTLPGPQARLLGTATLLHAAATPGGPDIATTTTASTTTASTTIITATPTPLVQPETSPAAIARGQTITFDVHIHLPAGTLRDLRLDSVFPTGPARLSLVSTSVTRIGDSIATPTPTISPDGRVTFATLASTGAGTADDNAIDLRVTVRAEGTASGPATLQTVLTATSADPAAGPWSANVSSAVGVIVPPPPPILSGIWSLQHATTTMQVHPLGGMRIEGTTAPTGTLAVTIQDSALGHLSLGTATLGSLDAKAGTYVATGQIADLQEAARHLIFTPDQLGTARLTVTLVGSDGAVAQDAGAAITIADSADTTHLAQHFAPDPTTNFLTATADGQQTLGVGETYQGPVDFLRAQYIYDGTQSVVILAQTPSVFVKNFVGDAAVGLLSGQNVVDAGKGSNFLVGGTGDDIFFLDGRSAAVTWDTIVGFNKGDIATLFGFNAQTSRYWWDERAGAPGYEGRTMRVDLQGTREISASITFTGADRAITDSYAITTGQVAGIDYMTIFAL